MIRSMLLEKRLIKMKLEMRKKMSEEWGDPCKEEVGNDKIEAKRSSEMTRLMLRGGDQQLRFGFYKTFHLYFMTLPTNIIVVLI